MLGTNGRQTPPAPWEGWTDRSRERQAEALARQRLAALHPHEWQVLLEAARVELGLTT